MRLRSVCVRGEFGALHVVHMRGVGSPLSVFASLYLRCFMCRGWGSLGLLKFLNFFEFELFLICIAL